MTILETAAALRQGKVSSQALTNAALAAISSTNAENHAFITVLETSARAAAAHADGELAAGKDRGPLHGIPIAIKDVIYTRGVRTTGGSKLFENFVPEYNAAVLDRLLEAGAVIVGKTNMHELAYGITSSNPHYGAVKNTWGENRIPGGSSGGSGVAVNLGMPALGTDTGGSIRIPASFCGIAGLKVTFGRVSRYGVIPLGFSLDTVGPLAKTVRDAGTLFNAIAGYDPRDDATSRRPVERYAPPQDVSIRGLRIGVPQNFFFDRVQAEVAAAVRRAARLAETLGAKIVPVHVPDIEALNAIARIVLLAEASAVYAPKESDRCKIGADVLSLLDQGRLLSATEYINAQRVRRRMQHEFATLWNQADVLFTPTTPTTAPRIGETTFKINGETEDVRLATTRFVRGINLLGLPALSIPCGFDGRSLPIGLQIIAPPFAECLLLRVGAALEDMQPYGS